MDLIRVTSLVIGLVCIAYFTWAYWHGRGQKPQAIRKRSAPAPSHLNEDLAVHALSEDEDLLESVPLETMGTPVTLKQSEESLSLERPLVTPQAARPPKRERRFLALILTARTPNGFLGSDLQQAFHGLQMELSPDGLYRFNSSIDQTALFSVASLLEPGTFGPEWDRKKVPGVVFFMDASPAAKAMQAFEHLLRVARQMSIRLNGELKDERQQLLTVQRIEQIREAIRADLKVGSTSAASKVTEFV